MSIVTRVIFPSFMLQISGELYDPLVGSSSRDGAAVVISHPMTGVKEQILQITPECFPAMGSMFSQLPQDTRVKSRTNSGLEDRHQRGEDDKAAVSYLTSLEDKINGEGIGLCSQPKKLLAQIHTRLFNVVNIYNSGGAFISQGALRFVICDEGEAQPKALQYWNPQHDHLQHKIRVVEGLSDRV